VVCPFYDPAGKFIAGVGIVQTMLKKDERVLILPEAGDNTGVRLVPVRKGDRVVPVPIRDGKPVMVKLCPLTRGDRIAILTLRNGRKLALKLEKFSDSDLAKGVEVAGDLTIEY
jgi:hypothetical protein